MVCCIFNIMSLIGTEELQISSSFAVSSGERFHSGCAEFSISLYIPLWLLSPQVIYKLARPNSALPDKDVFFVTSSGTYLNFN